MRIAALFVLGALLLSAAPLVAPTASAGCNENVPGLCVIDPPCVVSLYNDPDCLVRNPCDPRYCDPAWP